MPENTVLEHVNEWLDGQVRLIESKIERLNRELQAADESGDSAECVRIAEQILSYNNAIRMLAS